MTLKIPYVRPFIGPGMGAQQNRRCGVAQKLDYGWAIAAADGIVFEISASSFDKPAASTDLGSNLAPKRRW